ncbi:MAG: translation elongation factor Ts [Clostridia bacterium]|nr:translation elongation factor Ts [Clostridia bacterium]
MAQFTAKDVMALREMSGAGMMDCKKALLECDGDMEKAMDYLREKSLAASAKKAARIAAEGIVGAYVDGDTGVLVEVNCETDFVAKTDDFKGLVDVIAKQIAQAAPATVEELMEQKLTGDDGRTVAEMINAAVAKIGEKITIRRFTRYEGNVDTYIHLGGKIGVIILVEGAEDKEAEHDVAMQIAAAKPSCISREDVDADEIEKEREILLAQARNEPKPKPENIIQKMVQGRIDKYYQEICLMDQAFVKDPSMSVGQMINGRFKVVSFVRYEMGEGLQKREDNFAEEVMSQMGK